MLISMVDYRAGVSTFQNHVHLGDSDELGLGDGSDLQIDNGNNHLE